MFVFLSAKKGGTLIFFRKRNPNIFERRETQMLKECFNFFFNKNKKKPSHRVIGNLKEFAKRHHLMKWGPCEISFIVFKVGVFFRALLHLT